MIWDEERRALRGQNPAITPEEIVRQIGRPRPTVASKRAGATTGARGGGAGPGRGNGTDTHEATDAELDALDRQFNGDDAKIRAELTRRGWR